MSYVRGVLFNLGYGLGVVVYSLATSLVTPLLPFRLRFRVMQAFAAFISGWLQLCCGIRCVVEGRENIPSSPCVVVSNHQSTWETFYLARLFQPVCAVLKKELTYIPFYGWSIRLLKPIIIDRSRKQNALKQVLVQGVARLQEGLHVMIFPEGTRVNPGEIKSHFAGGSLLAIKAGVPIVPVVHNAGLFWPARRIEKFPGTITLRIGSPIAVGAEDDAKALTQSVEAWMRQQSEQLQTVPQKKRGH
jgi:1-acyl-sn-glycerol-3-phosphate acyltransferase